MEHCDNLYKNRIVSIVKLLVTMFDFDLTTNINKLIPNLVSEDKYLKKLYLCRRKIILKILEDQFLNRNIKK